MSAYDTAVEYVTSSTSRVQPVGIVVGHAKPGASVPVVENVYGVVFHVSVDADSAGSKVTPAGLDPHVTCITATTGGPATHSGVNVGAGRVGVHGGSCAGIAIENVTSSPARVQLVGIVVGQAKPGSSAPADGPNV